MRSSALVQQQRAAYSHQHIHRLNVRASRPLQPRIRPAAASPADATAAAQSQEAAAPPGPDTIFQGLCNASGIDSSAVVIKRVSQDKGTGLFAARDIAKGDTVLRWVSCDCECAAAVVVRVCKAAGRHNLPCQRYKRQQIACSVSITQSVFNAPPPSHPSRPSSFPPVSHHNNTKQTVCRAACASSLTMTAGQ